MGVSNNSERFYQRVLAAIQSGRVAETSYRTGVEVRLGSEEYLGIGQFETYMRMAATNLNEAIKDLRYTIKRVERDCATVDKIADRGGLIPVIGKIFAVGQVYADVRTARPLGAAVAYIDWYEVGRGKEKLEQEWAFGRDLVRGWNQDASIRHLNEIRRITLVLDQEEAKVTAMDNALHQAAGLKPEKR